MAVNPSNYRDLHDKAESTARAILVKANQAANRQAFFLEGMNQEAYDLANVCMNLARENQELAQELVMIKQMIDRVDRTMQAATGQRIGALGY
jgi:hypothetical protein